ncbi:MAG: csuC [Polaromonas sp.]|nr:csuC [Polaromonas sp.]
MTYKFGQWALSAVGLVFFACAQAFAGEFTVNPVRLDLGPAAKSASVTVVNEGTEKLNFQLQAMDWAQDAAGKDQYSETNDLIFFPKLMSIEPGQEAVVRIGLKTGAAATERTFRLFIEELPGLVKKPEGNGAQINFLIRFGLPIFVAPIQHQDGLAIETLELKNGVVSISARNTGNRHHVFKSLRLEGLDSAGKPVYGFDIADRYLLASTRKSYATTISAKQCLSIAVLGIEIQTDRLTETRKLDVARSMCP